MIVNPTLRLRWALGEARASALWLTRRDGPRSRELGAKVAATLLALVDGAAIDELIDSPAVAWLRQHELLVDDPGPLPSPWIPSLAEVEPAIEYARELRLDPDFAIARDGDTGAWLCERSPWLGHDWLRVRITPAHRRELAAAASGRTISTQLAARLVQIEALATPMQTQARRERRLRWLLGLRDAYRRSGWATARAWPPPAELLPLQRWAKARFDYGYQDGDFGVAGKRRTHLFDPPELASLHARAAVLASTIVGRRLVASYSFLAYYLRGGALPGHRDKSHCVVSMSLALHAAPSWPLVLEPLDGRPSVLQLETGELLLFDGRRLAHSRPPLGEDLAIHLILHFREDPEALA